MRSKASLRATVLNSTTGSAFEFCCSVYKQTDQHSWLWSQQEKHIHQFSHISKLTMIATKWCLPGIRQKGINEIFIDEKHDHLSDHQRPANLGPDYYVTSQIAWFSTCDVAWSLTAYFRAPRPLARWLFIRKQIKMKIRETLCRIPRYMLRSQNQALKAHFNLIHALKGVSTC